MGYKKILILSFCFFFLLVGCGKKTPPTQVPPVPVSALLIEAQTIPANFRYVGVAESSHIVELRARVDGYLEKISYVEGSLVKKGDLMFVLDQRPFIDTLESKKGDLARQKAVLWNAQQTKARMEPLYKENAVSERDLDNAIARELAAEAAVQTAEANVASAQLNLSFASIEAPVTGMASQAKFREGALISPGPNSLLTTIYVIDPIWVNFSVSEGDILKAQKEAAAGLLDYPTAMNFDIDIILADGTTLPAQGKIDFTNPALQQSTGTMLVRSVLPNHKGILRPGQFVRVVVRGATRPHAIIVSQTAVAQGQHGIYVYVIDENNQAQIRPVVPGDWFRSYWIINEGLKAGDRVITEGVNRVQNGTKVKVTKWASPVPPPSEKDDQNLGF